MILSPPNISSYISRGSILTKEDENIINALFVTATSSSMYIDLFSLSKPNPAS